MVDLKKYRMFTFLVFSFVAISTLFGRDSVQTNLMISADEWRISDITVSPAIPRQGKNCTIFVRLHNTGKKNAENISARIIIGRWNDENPIVKHIRFAKIPSGESFVESLKYTPVDNGIYKISAEIDPDNKINEADEMDNDASVVFPVVRRDVFLYYHSTDRKKLAYARYLTDSSFSPISRKKDTKLYWNQKSYWKKRGVRLARHLSNGPSSHCNWKQRVNYWEKFGRGWNRLIIDEFGIDYGGPKDQDCGKAIVEFKKRNPNVWFGSFIAGRIRKVLWQGFRESDAVMIESYLFHETQYRSSDWGSFLARKGGFAEHAFNVVGVQKDRWAGTPFEIENQIRSVRRARPTVMGIGLYLSKADEKLVLAADKVCYDYFIKPVLLLSLDAKGNTTVFNIGGMDARNIVLEIERGSDPKVKRVKIGIIKAGDEFQLPGANFKRVRVLPSDSYSVLNKIDDFKIQ